MMSNISTSFLRQNIKEYTQKSFSLAMFLFVSDYFIYVVALAGVILLDALLFKVLCGALVGLKMASLFVIAHDAAHDSYVSNRTLNRIIGRLAFLPCYHNYSLWLIAHNKLHHQYTNIKGLNSWSPLSKEDYDALPVWRQIVERLYRSPYGISVNYLVERWWKDKFYPYKRLVAKQDTVFWMDFILVSGFLVGQISLLTFLGHVSANCNVIEALLFGFVIPLLVFGFMVGFSVYQQHTHETVPWFKDDKDRKRCEHLEGLTMHVKFPHWYNLISHNVMEHTAHHVDPRIPCYNLAKAQKKLDDLMGVRMLKIKFSLIDFLSTMKKCKLYDYENHMWLDFSGEPTSREIVFVHKQELANAA